jgi:hypothetical protein
MQKTEFAEVEAQLFRVGGPAGPEPVEMAEIPGGPAVAELWCEGTFAAQKWGYNLTRACEFALYSSTNRSLHPDILCYFPDGGSL